MEPTVSVTYPVSVARYLAGYLTAVFARERREHTLDGWVCDLIHDLENEPPEPSTTG